MIFTSKDFLVLFVFFLIIYNILRKNFTWRTIYVTLFSLYFYYLSSGFYFFLLIFMSFSDYAIGYALDRQMRVRKRKLLLALSLCIDFGILCYFKYTDFFCSALAGLFHGDYTLKNIFLPIGISFFTFQSASYVIDIYRRELEPTSKWINYLFYLSFFPQLVAGPIVRARDFLPQISRRPAPTEKMACYGYYLIVLGLVKKVVIADVISVNFVDRVFDNPALYSGFENLCAIYGYTLQIYCDFSGYSDMAIGIAFLLGFRFLENFRLPYRATTVTEFWRRWHISLSSWLKDYIYISLGGNRKGKIRTYFNLMATMLIGGLWHGANIRFVLWGGLHGLALCIHKWLMSRFHSLKPTSEGMPAGQKIISTLLTLHFVAFCWIIFRAETMQDVFTMLKQIVFNFGWAGIPAIFSAQWKFCALIAAGIIAQFLPMSWLTSVKNSLIQLPVWQKVLLLVFVIWIVMQIQSQDFQPFIYFQF